MSVGKITFEESGMVFTFVDDSVLFRIEKSDLYKRFNQGICTTEFVSLDEKDTLQFVEAKTTCPNENTREDSEEKEKKYEDYYYQLTRKFGNSLMLYVAAMLGRVSSDEFGSALRSMSSLKGVKIRFLLIIKNAEEAWLGGAKAELERRLLTIRSIWKIEIRVLNEKMAKEVGIVGN